MQLFIPDGRLTPEGLVNILEKIQCSAWICTRDRPSTAPGQQTVVFPSLEEILTEDSNSTLAYPYDESWEHSKNEIVTIIHTSGTTGESSKFYQHESKRVANIQPQDFQSQSTFATGTCPFGTASTPFSLDITHEKPHTGTWLTHEN